MPTTDSAGAVLTIDLGAIVGNWRLLCSEATSAACAAVVKADAYGLGAAEVAPALAAAGCRVFFVATLDEGIALRQRLAADVAVLVADEDTAADSAAPAAGPPTIFVLNGIPAGGGTELVQHGLIPVLNSLACIRDWSRLAHWLERPLPAALHVDTGMSRLGLPRDELRVLESERDRLLDGVMPALVMSHLACADEAAHPMNAEQRDAFAGARRFLPNTPGSLANSSGIYLGADYHCELVRPGAALYGVNPQPDQPNPMQGVVTLAARILQVREIDSGTGVGYGATYRARKREKIATVAAGYADGFLRALSNSASGYLGDHRVPLVGRVSMDLITFDVTEVPDTLARPGATVELIGPSRPVDAVAADAGTIGYEILTSLGSRYARAYRPAGG